MKKEEICGRCENKLRYVVIQNNERILTESCIYGAPFLCAIDCSHFKAKK